VASSSIEARLVRPGGPICMVEWRTVTKGRELLRAATTFFQ
jgi:hypothetical protein